MIEALIAAISELLKSNPLAAGIAFLFITGLIRDMALRKAHDRGIKAVSEASVLLVAPLTSQIQYIDQRTTICEKKLDEMAKSNERLFAGIGILTTQVLMLNEKPLWSPNDADRIVITRGGHIEYL